MKNIIKTPLPVIYLCNDSLFVIEDNLNLCRASQVWGVCVYDAVGEENIFISKTNGHDVTLSRAYDYCYDVFNIYCMNDIEYEVYMGLPHYHELLALIMGDDDLVNDTMAIFREYGIVADNLFGDPYLAFSEEVFRDAQDVHLRRLVQEKKRNEAKMFKALRMDDGAQTVISFSQEDLGKYKHYHTRLFLHQC